MLALETFGGLDGERLAVAIRARRTINRDFKLRARCRPQFCRALHRHLPFPQSSSASRFTAGAAGFLNLSQSFDRPLRYVEPRRLLTMPSKPSLQAWRNTTSPGSAMCSLNYFEQNKFSGWVVCSLCVAIWAWRGIAYDVAH